MCGVDPEVDPKVDLVIRFRVGFLFATLSFSGLTSVFVCLEYH